MHGDFPLLITLTGGLAAALILGYVSQRLGLSPIVGYLLAGVAVGPATPGFVADHHLAEQFAEIGIILLMFGVGLSFHLKELLAVRRIAVPGALVQIAVATTLGAVLGLSLGWDLKASIVMGLCISVASTVVLVRVLADNRELHTPTGHIAVGWLVVEDIFTVLALVLLPTLFGSGAVSGSALAAQLGLTALKIGALLAVAVLLGRRLIPWLLGRVARSGSRELFTLTILVLALGIAVGSAELFGVSMALGAFLAGMIVGRSDFSLRAATEALPMRDAFAVLFFVSVGMLFDWQQVASNPMLVLLTCLIVLIGKPLAAIAITLLLGYPLRTALAVAIALAQIGEFTFILAGLAESLDIIPASASAALVASAILSIALNPLLYRVVNPLNTYLSRTRLFRRLQERQIPDSAGHAVDVHFDAVIVGYGPVGSTAARLLAENEIVPSIIDMNLDTVRELKATGINAVYGDATQIGVLKAAGVEHARVIILSASGLGQASDIISQARELNPRIQVLSRASYLAEQADLIQAGANFVLTDEGEVAQAMVVEILRQLGATPEQLDRERERVRGEHAA